MIYYLDFKENIETQILFFEILINYNFIKIHEAFFISKFYYPNFYK